MVEWDGLENRCAGNRTEGSNPSLSAMSGIAIELHNQIPIMVIDFSNCKEPEMIALLLKAREMIIEKREPTRVVAVFNEHVFITPCFMDAFRTQKREALKFIVRQAVVGMTDTQKIILQGYNMFFDRNLVACASKEEAIEYLTSENATG